MTKSAMEEKLKEIDREILTLHQFCVSKGFNPQQIQENAGPLLSIASAYRRKRFSLLLIKMALVVLIFGLLFYLDPVNKFFWASARILSIKVKEYFLSPTA